MGQHSTRHLFLFCCHRSSLFCCSHAGCGLLLLHPRMYRYSPTYVRGPSFLLCPSSLYLKLPYSTYCCPCQMSTARGLQCPQREVLKVLFASCILRHDLWMVFPGKSGIGVVPCCNVFFRGLVACSLVSLCACWQNNPKTVATSTLSLIVRLACQMLISRLPRVSLDRQCSHLYASLFLLSCQRRLQRRQRPEQRRQRVTEEALRHPGSPWVSRHPQGSGPSRRSFRPARSKERGTSSPRLDHFSLLFSSAVLPGCAAVSPARVRRVLFRLGEARPDWAGERAAPESIFCVASIFGGTIEPLGTM